MTKDYRHQLDKKHQEKGVPGFIWMLCGLGIGLMVAGLVYLRSGMPIDEAVPRESVSVDKSVVVEEKPEQTTKKSAPRPRFEFYTILRDMEVVVPDHKISGPTHHGVRQVEEEGTYVLQVGSFRSDEQADRLKARLVLLGLDVSIKPVDMGQNGKWYRVLAGPYRDLEKLNKSRMQLQEQNITTLLLKVKVE